MFGDFVLLNLIIQFVAFVYWRVDNWPERSLEIFVLVNNMALMLAHLRFSPIIHLRLVGAGDLLKRMVGLTALQAVLAYVLLKIFDYDLPIGWIQWGIGTLFIILLLFKRLSERWFIKLYRQAGRNTRTVTLVGSDSELAEVYCKLKNDTTLGYRILGYYGDESLLEDERLKGLEHLGSYDEFLEACKNLDSLQLGDECRLRLLV